MHTRADRPPVRARRQARAEAEPWPTPRPLASALSAVCSFDPDLLPETQRPWVLDLAERLQIPPD
jgi:putative DNA primase/helicase